VKKGDTLYRIALENGQDYKDLANWNGIPNPSSIKEGQVLRVAPPGSSTDAQVGTKPIGTAPVVESRPLDSKPTTTPSAVATDALKREPRVGKEPYSDEAYARLNKGNEALKPVEVKNEAKPEIKPEPQPAGGPDDLAWAWPSTGKMVAPFSEAGNKGLDFAGKVGDAVLAAGDGKVVYAGSGLRGYGELVIVKHNATYLSAYAHNRKILVKEGQAVTRGQKIAEMGNTDADSVKLHFEIRKQGKPIDPLQYLPKK
jgi:lipoprotein NlpD